MIFLVFFEISTIFFFRKNGFAAWWARHPIFRDCNEAWINYLRYKNLATCFFFKNAIKVSEKWKLRSFFCFSWKHSGFFGKETVSQLPCPIFRDGNEPRICGDLLSSNVRMLATRVISLFYVSVSQSRAIAPLTWPSFRRLATFRITAEEKKSIYFFFAFLLGMLSAGEGAAEEFAERAENCTGLSYVACIMAKRPFVMWCTRQQGGSLCVRVCPAERSSRVCQRARLF